MSWVLLSLGSAILLGCYDLAKKHALRDNAVLPVLYFGIVTGGLVWLPMVLWAAWSPASYPFPAAQPGSLDPAQHLLVLGKSALVASSWIFAYFALKHLPLSIGAPIRATGPFWTVLAAVILLNEMPVAGQWAGIVLVTLAFLAFSLVSRREGIHFHRNRWVGCMIAATLIGSCSALYDKYLIQTVGIDPPTLQAWFSIDLVLVMWPVFEMWRRGVWARSPFRWSWAIPMIGLLLLAADFLYFTALTHPDALISVVSPLRRASVVIPFLGGIWMHKEKQFLAKLPCVLLLLAGVVWIQLASAK